jgi:ribosomal protein L29
MSQRIKPIPKEALDLLGITVERKQNNEPVSQPITDIDKRIAFYNANISLSDERIKEVDKSIDESQKEIAKTKKEIAELKAKASTSSGGNKKKDTYTVKELKTIASRNNIKTTKKLNGKTVPLNKKGLVAKLKRNKVI